MTRFRQPTVWMPAAALCIMIALSLLTAVTRAPWSDEGWFSSAAYNLATKGFPGTTVIEPSNAGLTRIDQHTYWTMPLYFPLQALWYKLAPSSIGSTRAFTLLMAVAGWFAFIGVLRGLGIRGPVVSALAPTLLACDYVFIYNSAFARPDFQCFAFGLAGLAAYLNLRERNLAWALILGNAGVVLSTLSHPNGILHFAGLVFLVLRFDRRRLNFGLLALAALPYVIFGAGYALYIAQDPQAFADQMGSNGNGNGRWTTTLNPLALIWNEFRWRYYVAFGLATGGIVRLKLVVLLSFVAAIVGALFDRSFRAKPGIRELLWLILIYFGIQCVFNQKLDYYLVHIEWLYVALLASWVSWLWNQRPSWKPALAAWMLLLIAIPTSGLLIHARVRSYKADMGPALDYLREHAANAHLIFGTAALVFDMNFDPRLLDDSYLGVNSGRRADYIVVETIYHDYYAGWQYSRADDFRKIASRLAEYSLVYDRNGYRIYGPATEAISPSRN